MKTFGIISEGPTDQIIIENILIGFFNNIDLSTNIRFLQPLRDNTDQENINQFGGWYKVFEFCQSQKLIDAFEQNDFLIIQVDTDVCEEEHYNVKKTKVDGSKLTNEELIQSVIQKFEFLFINSFGDEKFNEFKERIIYAICVDEIECWVLPLYYDNAIKYATNNCIHKLNPKLKEQFDFYIDKANKSNQVSNYDKMTRNFMKNKVLMRINKENISLGVFIESISNKSIEIETD